MVELLTQPPPLEAVSRMTAVDGVQIAPTMLTTQRGPDGHLGPEDAGAVLILQGTFVNEASAAQFWRAATELTESLATAPGFIRRFNFTDGPHFTVIALWRSPDDANVFFRSDAHQTAMRELFEQRWQYSHFAGLWEMVTPRQRVIFCQHCEGVTPVSAGACSQCGEELFDPFAVANHVGH